MKYKISVDIDPLVVEAVHQAIKTVGLDGLRKTSMFPSNLAK